MANDKDRLFEKIFLSRRKIINLSFFGCESLWKGEGEKRLRLRVTEWEQPEH